MATTECILHSLTEMDRLVRLMAAATGTAGIVHTVSAADVLRSSKGSRRQRFGSQFVGSPF